MKAKQISQRFWNSNQSWHFERIVSLKAAPNGPAVKLRVEICRNAYDFQSHMCGYAFDPAALKWNLLVSRPIAGAACEGAKYFRANESVKPFEADAASILEELKAIVLEEPSNS